MHRPQLRACCVATARMLSSVRHQATVVSGRPTVTSLWQPLAQPFPWAASLASSSRSSSIPAFSPKCPLSGTRWHCLLVQRPKQPSKDREESTCWNKTSAPRPSQTMAENERAKHLHAPLTPARPRARSCRGSEPCPQGQRIGHPDRSKRAMRRPSLGPSRLQGH